ncbi:phage holin family protein [Lentilactobacillus sp. Marseille-Q4993]|uniref:phage holin family protein n=1 Tax=Lentilactobacillus sp. Marseille-Q4993 TaxID=3039492 RepID=UPI0024BCBCBD|nr:phage holin family protein [Lentilactobacillus sp. Marseille-Q4993]
MRFLTNLIINTILFMAISGFLPNSFYVSSFGVALGAALVLAILNFLVKPLLTLFTLPINFLTFGLFSLIINGLMLEMTSMFIGNQFKFSSFWTAVLVAILMSIVNSILASYFSRE